MLRLVRLEIQMSKSKYQKNVKFQNPKNSSDLSFGLDLTFELWHLAFPQ
jgi:hypothetical protein